VRDVLEWVRDPEVVRYFLINSQYRGPINYTPESLAQADAALERLYLALRGLATDATYQPSAVTERFVAAMDDDFNTPIAVAELQTLAREINTAKTAGDVKKAGQGAAELRALASRLGFLRLEPDVFLRKQAAKQAASPEPAQIELRGGEASFVISPGVALSDADIDRLIDERAAARKAKNFKESDRIRDLLAASGVVLEDQPGGKTLWRRG
jgi:cysteinyl-tRNA synthetase